MRRVWAISDAIVSPLGITSKENFVNLSSGVSGLRSVNNTSLSASGIFAGRMDLGVEHDHTRFESMCLTSLREALRSVRLPGEKTVFILSTTKGNISEIDKDHPRLSLYATAKYLAGKIGLSNVQVVSNACISGVMAMTIASRFLRSGKFDHAVILGADELTPFVVSGFKSLQALSDERCRPFDANRKGINLGEAAATVVLSVDRSLLGETSFIEILGSGLTNDSNHISGPSRTGEELALAIKHAFKESARTANDIDFISAHGTATPYNDEMEAKAFALAQVNHLPVNSLKPYYGHTLGAAGVLETLISIHSLRGEILLPTLGFETSGVSQPVNVITEVTRRPVKAFLKTASGFGGCNAAIVVQKVS